MATKNFTVSKDASVVLTSTSQNLGQGAGDNVAVGYEPSTGWKMRGLMEFNLDFTGVTAITSATLYVQAYQRSGFIQLAWEMGSGMDIYRNTASWSEGNKGADGIWYSTNAVTWSNKPAYTSTGYKHISAGSSTGQIPNATPSTGAIYQLDVTDIVKSWAPSATVTGGGDAANYGITLKMTDETSANGGGVEFRTKEDSTINGGSSYAGAYIVLTYTSVSAPTGTPSEPGTSGEVATIYNLGDTELTWSSTSKTALPTLAWSYVENGGGAQSSWRVRIYDTSTGGNTIFDSGTVTASGYKTATSINVPRYNTTTGGATDYVATYCPGGSLADNGGLWASGYDGLVGATQYWWNVEVTSVAGLTSTATTRYPFKVRWGQKPYYFDLGASFTSTAEHQTVIGSATNTAQAVRLYASSSSNTTVPTTWYPTLTAATPAGNQYLWVLVRLAENANRTSGAPTVAGLDATWNSSASQPDGWAIDTTVASHSLALTPSKRRFGTRAAKFTLAGASGSISAYRLSPGDGVPVVQNTVYTFSCYVNDNGTDGVGASGVIKLKIFQGSGSGSALAEADLLATSDPHTSFTAIDKDPTTGIGWRRMSVTFESGGYTVIRPAVECSGVSSGKIIYVDGALVEEGSVIRSYTPGTVNSTAVVEGIGVQIDASAGGKMRLRGSSGGSRDIIELGTNGLVFGGSANSANLYSPSADTLATDDSLTVAGNATVSGNIELGNASDTTLSRASAGVISVEGVNVVTVSGTQTLTNKTLTDSTTSFQDETDNTKKMQLQISGVTTGTTRTLTVPNASGTIALTSDLTGTTWDLDGDVTVTAETFTLGGANTLTVSVDNDSHSHTGTTLSAIGGTSISTGAITAAKIAANTITGTEIAAGAIGASELSSSISITTSGTMTPTGTADITTTSGYNSVYMGGSTGVVKRFYRFTGVSEERLKENIEPTSLKPDAIYGLNPIDFNFKASASEQYPNIEFPTTRQWGITVENAREVFPSAISGGHDGDPYGIHWERVYFGMLVAIKDLNARVLTLEAKIAELEGNE
jgi:hypothetical protein